MIAGTKDKAGKAAIGAISRRTERLVTGYLAALGATLRGKSIERSNALHRTYAPADGVAVQNVDEA